MRLNSGRRAYVKNPMPVLMLAENPYCEVIRYEFETIPGESAQAELKRRKHHESLLDAHNEQLAERTKHPLIKHIYNKAKATDIFDKDELFLKINEMIYNGMRKEKVNIHRRRAIKVFVELLAISVDLETNLVEFDSLTSAAKKTSLATMSSEKVSHMIEKGEEVTPNISRLTRAYAMLCLMGFIKFNARVLTTDVLHDIASGKDGKGTRYMPRIIEVDDKLFELLGVNMDRLEKEREWRRENRQDRLNLRSPDEIKNNVILSRTEIKKRHKQKIRLSSFDYRRKQITKASQARRAKSLQEKTKEQLRDMARGDVFKTLNATSVESLSQFEFTQAVNAKFNELLKLKNSYTESPPD